MSKGTKRLLALLLTLAICVSTTGVAAYAEETVVTDLVNTESGWDGVTTVNNYTGENFNVVFSLANYWEGGYNANVKVENTGSSVIENWYLSFVLDNNFSSIWNAEVVSNENGQYVVKNANWNADIPVGGCVEFGISVNETFAGFPKEYKLLGESTQVQEEAYSVEYILDNDWGTGFTARMLLTNHTETALEDWILEFDFDREITNIWNGVIESHEGNHYVIKNAGYNANVVSGSAISFGFNGEGGTAEDVPENCELSSYTPGNIETEIDFEDVTDTDGDYLTDALETYYKTDKSNPDTDGDSLSDYIEIVILGTSPLTPETTEGVPDVTLDSDEDGLSNGEEIRLGLDPGDDDTDCDLVKDAEELKLGTDPLNYDTDGDGASDGWEVSNGTNPSVAESTFDVKYTSTYKDMVKASVELELTGEQVETLAVDPVLGDYLFPEDMPGYIGAAYNFSVEGNFDTAKIFFECEDGLSLEKKPTIYYFNETEQMLEALETTIEGNVASAVVEHFSTYILVYSTVYESAFEWQDIWEVTGNYDSIEIVFVIDDSGSMSSNDYSNQRLSVAKELITNLPEKSKIGIVQFASSVYRLTPEMTTDKDAAKKLLSTSYFKSSGGTYMYSAINSAFGLFTTSDESTLRMMVVLSDGSSSGTNQHSACITTAQNKGIRIYTVGLGSSTSYFNSYLRPLAESTNAAFYPANEASELKEIYKEIQKGIDLITNSDEDSIPDYYEEHMYSFNGKKIKLNKYLEDTDGDEVWDDKEIEVKMLYTQDGTKALVFGKIKSYPDVKDTDNDSIDDLYDPDPMEYTITDRTLAMVEGLSYSDLSEYEGQTVSEAVKNGAEIDMKRMTDDGLQYLGNAIIVYSNDSGTNKLPEDTVDRGLGSLALKFVRRNRPTSIIYGLRGTEFDDDFLNDFPADVVLFVGWDTGQSKIAFDEYKRLANRNSTYDYYVTGHSLGGRLAQDVIYKIYNANEGGIIKKNAKITPPVHNATFNSLGYNKAVYKTLENNILAEYKDKLVNFYYGGDFVGDYLGESFGCNRAGIQVKLSRKDLDENKYEPDASDNHGIRCWMEEYSLLYTSPHSFFYWVD